MTDQTIDFVVIGSGFGGSVSAMRLTEKGYRVLVLERGKRFRDQEGEPRLELHSADAASRGIADGDTVRVFNDRGSYTLRARVNDKPRRGVVVAPSVWWKKFARDRRNANDLTSQRTADLGGAATYYDCLVEVERSG